MTQGKLLTIEGIEGAGKSTLIKCIANYLEKMKISFRITREPGGTTIAEKIRHILLEKNIEKIHAKTELLLMFASRNQHLHEVILPALKQNIWVISDRYIDASYAYQGGGRGIDMAFIQDLDKWVVNGCYPDLTFLLDLPATLGLMRTESRGTQKDRIEQETVKFFDQVRDVYLQRAKNDRNRIKIIDASLPLKEVQNTVENILKTFI